MCDDYDVCEVCVKLIEKDGYKIHPTDHLFIRMQIPQGDFGGEPKLNTKLLSEVSIILMNLC